jgi:exopolyphosphatase/guanosine-5'-triphosphate,3'-diphosphate pyrophosphatase
MKTKTENQRENELKYVHKLAKDCQYEAKHTKQVTRSALKIFDDLQNLHRLGSTERFYLECAGILHDIGVHTQGAKGHHKTSLNIILTTPILQFNNKERLIIGSVVRYHRRALPSTDHDHYKALNEEERKKVSILAGILRVADGLDYTHRRKIGHVEASFNEHKIIIDCLVRRKPVKKEMKSALAKSTLLTSMFDRELVLRIHEGEEFSGWS